MPRIHVSYGPPGERGVTSIMGLGADEVAALSDKTDKALEKAGWIGVGIWSLGFLLNKKRLRDLGAGAAAASFLVKYAAR
jgi:hypothetical protein